MVSGIRVYLADDHTLFRKAIVNLLSTFDRIKEVKDAANGKELISLIKADPPDVAIIDLQMPVMDGASTCDYLLLRHPGVKLIVLTQDDDERTILYMMEKGVHAFMLKSSNPDELEKAIYGVVDHDFYHNDLVTSILRKSLRQSNASLSKPSVSGIELSDREKEILGLICDELTIREIGLRLNLSENTVRNHRVKMMEKLGVRNTVGLVKYAYESGLVN